MNHNMLMCPKFNEESLVDGLEDTVGDPYVILILGTSCSIVFYFVSSISWFKVLV